MMKSYGFCLVLLIALVGKTSAKTIAANPRCYNNAFGPNLLKNGGFETGKVHSQGYLELSKGSKFIDNWEITAGAIDWIYNSYWTPSQGKYSLDMNQRVAGSIRQEFSTDGTANYYTLSFMMAGNPGVGNSGTSIKTLTGRILTASGTVIANQVFTFDTKGKSGKSMGWALKKMDFQTIQGQKTYYVQLFSSNKGNSGPALDDVVICGGAPVQVKCGLNNLNLVKNGDFEVGPIKPNSKGWMTISAPSTVIPNWRVADASVDWMTAPPGWQAATGAKSIDLNGVTGGTLEQDITLPAQRAVYRLSFAMGGNPWFNWAKVGYPSMQVTVTSNVGLVATQVFTFKATGVSASNMKYDTDEMVFTSTQGQTQYTISFEGKTPGSGGVALDSVTLCATGAIPPPLPVSPCLTGPNGITNGHFDQGVYPKTRVGSTRLTKGSTDITGWTVAAGSVDYIQSQFINFAKSSRSVGFVGAGSAITQTFDINTGDANNQHLYQFALRMSAYPQASLPASLEVVITRADNAHIVQSTPFAFNKKTTTTSMIWDEKTVSFFTVPGVTKYVITITDKTSSAVGSVIDFLTLCDKGPQVSTPVCPNGQSYIKNGGFDSSTQKSNKNPFQPLYANKSPSLASVVDNWRLAAGSVDWIYNLWQNSGNSLHSIDMTGSPGQGVLQQDVTLPAARGEYSLNFALAGNPGATPIKSLTTTIYIKGTTTVVSSKTFTFDIRGKSVKDMGWTRRAHVFNSVQGTTAYTVEFKSNTPGAQGAAIDSVALCFNKNVPPPSVKCTVASSTNVIKNGNFETGSPKPSFTTVSKGQNTIPSWTVAAGDVDYIGGLWVGADGTKNSVDLDGNKWGTLQQTFSLPATKAFYELDFKMAGNYVPKPVVKRMKVSVVLANSPSTVVATKIFSFSVAGKSAKDMGWAPRQLTFTSVQGQTGYIVQFTSLTGGTAYGPALDEVSLCATSTPPPAPLPCLSGTAKSLIANGDFEQGKHNNAPFQYLTKGSTNIFGWDIVSGTVDYIQGYWADATPQGKRSVDLNGLSAATFRQTFQVDASTPRFYHLSFMMAGNPASGPSIKPMQVTIYTAAGARVATAGFTFDITGKTVTNMGWGQRKMEFASLQGVASYIVEFKSLIPGSFGAAIDDVVLCAGDEAKGKQEGEIVITADNTFIAYVDGQELVPPDAAAEAANCVGGLHNPGKYCCNQLKAGAKQIARCDWTRSETYKIDVTNTSVLAVSIVNYQGGHANPYYKGNPAAMLMQYKRNGQMCAVSSAEWRCTHAPPVLTNNAWTTYNYDDSAWTPAFNMGANAAGAWVGTPGASRFKGNSIWYAVAGNKPVAGITPAAQWVWSDINAGEVQAWCRLYIPTLIC